MTRASTRPARLLISALSLVAALAAGSASASASAAPTDLGPRGGPPAVVACPPIVGGEVNTLCAPRPAYDPCSEHPGRCRIED